jgi:hypothetical protein|tara:strand:- start:577 stop:816 length:240 start_codon:yes stop_codon:yes gene_type:complete
MNKNRKSLVDAMSTKNSRSIIATDPINKAEDNKKVIFRVPAEAHYQLKKLALEERSQIQTLAQEALNDLFIKYKLPPIV